MIMINKRILLIGKNLKTLNKNKIFINNNTKIKRELSTFNPRQPDNEDGLNLALGFLLGYFTGIMMYGKK